MTPERADWIELELRRAAMSGPLDDRQRLIGLALELLAGYRRAHDLHRAAASTADMVRIDYLELLRQTKGNTDADPR